MKTKLALGLALSILLSMQAAVANTNAQKVFGLICEDSSGRNENIEIKVQGPVTRLSGNFPTDESQFGQVVIDTRLLANLLKGGFDLMQNVTVVDMTKAVTLRFSNDGAPYVGSSDIRLRIDARGPSGSSTSLKCNPVRGGYQF